MSSSARLGCLLSSPVLLASCRAAPLSALGHTCAALGASSGARRFLGTKHLDWYAAALRRQEALRTQVSPPPYPAEPLHGRKRARVFFDLQFGRDAGGEGAEAAAGAAAGGAAGGKSNASPANAAHRVVFELADDIVPTTCRNFVNVRCGRAGEWVWRRE